MVKLKSKSKINYVLGMINNKNVYFKPGEVMDLEESAETSELIANAVDQGFLEIVSSEGAKFVKKVVSNFKKEEPKKAAKEELKEDKESTKED